MAGTTTLRGSPRSSPTWKDASPRSDNSSRRRRRGGGRGGSCLGRMAVVVLVAFTFGWMWNISAVLRIENEEQQVARYMRNPSSMMLDLSNLSEEVVVKKSPSGINKKRSSRAQAMLEKHNKRLNLDGGGRRSGNKRSGADPVELYMVEEMAGRNPLIKRQIVPPQKEAEEVVLTASEKKWYRPAEGKDHDDDDDDDSVARAREVKSLKKKRVTVKRKIEELVKRYPQSCGDKEPFLRIIFSAEDNRRRVMHDRDSEQLCRSLPSQEQVNAIHGSEAIVHGMDMCERYREMLKPEHNNDKTIKPKPRVAGLYHTGTNGFCRTFDHNIRKLPARTSYFSPYEVPWGKHLPPAVHRLNNTYPPNNKENRELVLPVVLIRDPFYWMQSMCKTRYDAKWVKPDDNRCPNLIRIPENMTTYEVNARTHQSGYNKEDHYKSIADMWNDYYMQYFEADYPRLMVRFEDTLYRLEKVVEKVRECIGMNKTDDKPFVYHISSAKVHGQPQDFVKGLQKYATTQSRHRGMNEYDRQYARRVLNPELMRIFNYSQVPLEVPPADLSWPFGGWKTKKKENTEPYKPGKPVRNVAALSKMLQKRREDKLVLRKRADTNEAKRIKLIVQKKKLN